jgi:hypothetical protein
MRRSFAINCDTSSPGGPSLCEPVQLVLSNVLCEDARRGARPGPGVAHRQRSFPAGAAVQCCAALRRMLNRYAYVLMVQLATASACRRFHDIESRLTRRRTAGT